jgi:hypothetical protein
MEYRFYGPDTGLVRSQVVAGSGGTREFDLAQANVRVSVGGTQMTFSPLEGMARPPLWKPSLLCIEAVAPTNGVSSVLWLRTHEAPWRQILETGSGYEVYVESRHVPAQIRPFLNAGHLAVRLAIGVTTNAVRDGFTVLDAGVEMVFRVAANAATKTGMRNVAVANVDAWKQTHVSRSAYLDRARREPNDSVARSMLKRIALAYETTPAGGAGAPSDPLDVDRLVSARRQSSANAQSEGALRSVAAAVSRVISEGMNTAVAGPPGDVVAIQTAARMNAVAGLWTRDRRAFFDSVFSDFQPILAGVLLRNVLNLPELDTLVVQGVPASGQGAGSGDVASAIPTAVSLAFPDADGQEVMRLVSGQRPDTAGSEASAGVGPSTNRAEEPPRVAPTVSDVRILPVVGQCKGNVGPPWRITLPRQVQWADGVAGFFDNLGANIEGRALPAVGVADVRVAYTVDGGQTAVNLGAGMVSVERSQGMQAGQWPPRLAVVKARENPATDTLLWLQTVAVQTPAFVMTREELRCTILPTSLLHGLTGVLSSNGVKCGLSYPSLRGPMDCAFRSTSGNANGNLDLVIEWPAGARAAIAAAAAASEEKSIRLLHDRERKVKEMAVYRGQNNFRGATAALRELCLRLGEDVLADGVGDGAMQNAIDESLWQTMRYLVQSGDMKSLGVTKGQTPMYRLLTELATLARRADALDRKAGTLSREESRSRGSYYPPYSSSPSYSSRSEETSIVEERRRIRSQINQLTKELAAVLPRPPSHGTASTLSDRQARRAFFDTVLCPTCSLTGGTLLSIEPLVVRANAPSVRDGGADGRIAVPAWIALFSPEDVANAIIVVKQTTAAR